jgi:hypothetical protein
MRASSLAGSHFLTLGVDHFFLGLFLFGVPLCLILVFFAFRFFAIWLHLWARTLGATTTYQFVASAFAGYEHHSYE